MQNGHHQGTPSTTDDDEDDDNPMAALHAVDPYNTGGVDTEELLNTLMQRQEADGHMEVAAQPDDHPHRQYPSSSGRATSHYGYQGHQHTHQTVRYLNLNLK